MKFSKHSVSILVSYVIGIIIILPVLWLLVSSLKSESEIINSPFSLPRSLQFDNFALLFSTPGFYKSFVNSLLIAICTTVITGCITIPSSYLFSRYNFPYKRFLRIFSLTGAYLFAPAILAFPYFKILSFFGLVNTIQGIVFTHIGFCLPFSLSVGDLIFRSVPRQLEEVAILDGASSYRRLLKLVIPSALPQVIALFLLVFAISWKEFFFAFVISSDTTSRTLPVMLANLYGGESLNWNMICALSTVTILPSLLVMFFGGKIKTVSLLTPGMRG